MPLKGRTLTSHREPFVQARRIAERNKNVLHAISYARIPQLRAENHMVAFTYTPTPPDAPFTNVCSTCVMLVNRENGYIPEDAGGTAYVYAVRTDHDCGRETCCFSEDFNRDAYMPQPLPQADSGESVKLALPAGMEGVEEVALESDEFGVLELDAN